jgi:hypothetical protein
MKLGTTNTNGRKWCRNSKNLKLRSLKDGFAEARQSGHSLVAIAGDRMSSGGGMVMRSFLRYLPRSVLLAAALCYAAVFIMITCAFLAGAAD